MWGLRYDMFWVCQFGHRHTGAIGAHNKDSLPRFLRKGDFIFFRHHNCVFRGWLVWLDIGLVPRFLLMLLLGYESCRRTYGICPWKVHRQRVELQLKRDGTRHRGIV